MANTYPVAQESYSKTKLQLLRLVFTSDGVVVGVVLRSAEPIRSSKNKTDGFGSRTLILLATPSLTIK